MTKRLTLNELRERAADLPAELGDSSELVAVTDNGKPALAVMTWEAYES